MVPLRMCLYSLVGVGFFTATNSGQTTYQPLFEPLLAAPVGPRLLVESRAILLEAFSPKGGNQTGYDHSHFISLTYLQGNYTLTSHITVVGGTYLIPFNTYNDRLSPIWIGNFQGGPLTAGLGSLYFGTGIGGMLSGSGHLCAPNTPLAITPSSPPAKATHTLRPSVARGEVAALCTFQSSAWKSDCRTTGCFRGTQENFYGVHLWWEPKDSRLSTPLGVLSRDTMPMGIGLKRHTAHPRSGGVR